MSMFVNPRKPSKKPPQPPASDLEVLNALQAYHQKHKGKWPTLHDLVAANSGWNEKIAYNRLFTLRGSNHDPSAPPPVVRDHDTETYRLQGEIPAPKEEPTEGIPAVRPTDAELLAAEAEFRGKGGSIYRELQKRFGHPQSTLGGWLKQARDKQTKPACDHCKDTGHVGESGVACRCDKGDIIAQALTEECLIVGRDARVAERQEATVTTIPVCIQKLDTDVYLGKNDALGIFVQGDSEEYVMEHLRNALEERAEDEAADAHSATSTLLLMDAKGCRVHCTRTEEEAPNQHDEWPQVIRTNGRAKVKIWVCYAALNDVRVMIPREGVTLLPQDTEEALNHA